MTTAENIAWFKKTFGARIGAGLEGTPFSLDLVTAIANQETGYIWGPLVAKGVPQADLLRLCVGDTLDSDRGRSCFPRNKNELLAAPRGAEMFAIARQALIDMARHVRGYEGAAANPNKFCHGFGIFQYDIQFFRENPDYFLQKSWGDFDACLAQFVLELKQAMKRQGWANKSSLTDEERVFVAIAYNKGKADCERGFKQGHMCDGRCYGENVYDFMRIAQGIPVAGVAAAVQLPALPVPVVSRKPPFRKKLAPVFEVNVREVPLRLRSEPRISAPNPGSNVIARLSRGQLVQRVSKEEAGDFVEIETIFDGKKLRGFASKKFLRLVKRAQLVKPVKSERKKKKTASARKPRSTKKRAKTRKSRSKAKTATARKTVRKKRPKKKKTTKKSPAVTRGDLENSMDIEAIIRAVQKELGIGVDGKAGPETWRAIYLRLKGKKAGKKGKKGAPVTVKGLPSAATGTVDARSEKTIGTLQPEVQPYARALVLKAAALGITIKVISGLRTYEEQDELYAQGRTKRGRRVTNARGGYSNHNFGIAFDIGVFDGSSYVPESPKYKAVGALGVELGLEWGGNWKTIKDEPHFQLRPTWAAEMSEREMLAELRSRKEDGRGYYA